VLNKKSEVVRVYLPPDANTLLSTYDHCLRSRQYANVVVAGKQPALDYLTMDEAVLHCTAASASGSGPATTRATCCPTSSWPAPATSRRSRRSRPCRSCARSCRPAVRVVNVVDLMRLQPEDEHPHGMPDREFDALFTEDRPVVFAFHGYPWLVHRLTYRRTNHNNFHVRGFKEEGTTTTPFDMVMMNDLDRYHLVMDVVDRVPGSALAPPTCVSGWWTAGSGRGCTPASTARTCRRSPAGRGRARGAPIGREVVGSPRARSQPTASGC
jgi:xylulose-5-phosphate/fructose-6-phosphate phosphoketolase